MREVAGRLPRWRRVCGLGCQDLGPIGGYSHAIGGFANRDERSARSIDFTRASPHKTDKLGRPPVGLIVFRDQQGANRLQGECPERQRGRTVNPLAMPSQVRVLPLPPLRCSSPIKSGRKAAARARDAYAASFRLLRQRRRPSSPPPLAKSGSAAGKGVADTLPPAPRMSKQLPSQLAS